MADAVQVQRRRGTAAQCDSMTPAEAEIIVDLTNDILRVGDGLRQGGHLIPNAAQIQNNAYVFANASGSQNNLSVNLSIPPAGYASPLGFYFKASLNNTGAVTINVDGLGARSIVKMSSTGLIPLIANDIISGGIYYVIYDGTQFILINSSASSIILSPGSNVAHPPFSIENPMAGTSYLPFGQRIFIPYSGTLRATFGLRSSRDSSSYTVYGRWYKNGSPIGTERSKNNTSSTTYSEEFPVSQGDVFQLYLRTTNAAFATPLVNAAFVSINQYLPSFVSY